MTGYYKSELQRGIDPEKQLAENNVGVVVSNEKLGAIFTWVPRLCYSEETIAFLKGTSIVEYIYKTEECFNLIGYGTKNLDLAFEGIWVGQTELSNASQVEQKNNEMNTEENTYGLIANELVQTLTSSDKTAVEKLYNKYNITNNASILQNINTMQNRQTIKIVNTNKRVPISGTHDVAGGNIIIKTKYNENKILYCTDKNGNKLENTHLAPIDDEEINYTFYILDEIGNIKKYTMSYGGGKPYLKGFNKNNTFYVVYNEGVPDTSIPIGEPAPDNWYDYDNQMWANIVCRENGQEIYYTWIPRYMYKLHDDTQSVEAIIVDLENKDIKTGKAVNSEEYTLPDAFTWESDEGKQQLTGYWISKYKLRDNTSYTPDIYGLAGTININNVVSQFGSSYTYETYLIKDGKRLVKNEEGEYVEGTEPVIITGNYKFTKVPAGEYTVNVIIKDSTGNDIQGITKAVTVGEKIAENKPNLSKYNINNTFYVVYNADGSETSYQPIGDIAQDQVKNWYDYDEDKKATIVVKDFGQETYYEWIPRYQCLISDSTRISYIPTSKTEPDAGYTIPSEFSGEFADGYWKQIATYSNRIIANMIAGDKNIAVSSITLPSSATKFDIYLIQNGKIIKQEQEQTGNSYTFTDLDNGTYIVEIVAKDTNGKTLAGYTENQTIITIEVDIIGYNENKTFYVLYDEAGNETSYLPIGKNAEKKATRENEPENWYDYSHKKYATIVVRDFGVETYYEWIPRYEYLNSNNSHIRYILTEQTSADTGYTIPSEFTDSNGNALNGYWKQKSTYTNRMQANESAESDKIVITNIVLPSSATKFDIYLIQDGKIINQVENMEENNYTYNNLETGKYVVNIIAKNADGKTLAGYLEDQIVTEIKVDLTGFNKSNTFYVVYDEDGNVNSTISIGEVAPKNWYDYTKQQWANIVVRDNGQELYYTYIPRYEYKLNDGLQKTKAMFIPTNPMQIEADVGYTIPEAFTWKDEESGQAKELPGYWISKYKLRDNSSYTPDIYGLGGIIRVDNVVSHFGNSYTYEAYLVNDQGKRIVKDENNNYVEGNTPVIITGNYRFTNLPEGNYTVNIILKDSAGHETQGIAKYVTVLPKVQENEPDLSQYNPNTTYFVMPNTEKEIGTIIPIGEDIPKGWYDYDEDIKATVVTRINGQETYYEWIPRYQQKTSDSSYISYIPTSKTEPDYGYTIPSVFTGENADGYWKQISSATSSSSYTPDIYGVGGTIHIEKLATSSYTYEAYLVKDGKRIAKNSTGIYETSGTSIPITADYKFTEVPKGEYTVNIIIKNSSGVYQIGFTKTVIVLEKTEAYSPELDEFNINTTYYVTYNILGLENENTEPIGAPSPANWYDYDEDIKATVIVRENGQETYYEWIPRYQYQNGHTDWISYISTEQTVPDEGYTIPNEFTNSDGNALKGYWKETTKYTNRMYANIAGGDDKIVISNIKTSSTILAYNVYLIKDGIVLNSGTTSDSYTFTGLTQGTYGVLITQKNLVSGSVDASYAQIVNIGVMEIPDVIGYMVDTTYIVVYDSEGNEDTTQNLRSVLSDDAIINADGALVSGKIDLNKINGTWYDYAGQRWANIVTINDGKTLYFTWIPRYEYMLNDANQATYARFIPKTQTEPDTGYKIPESFSWEGDGGKTQLAGYWISKYKLRD